MPSLPTYSTIAPSRKLLIEDSACNLLTKAGITEPPTPIYRLLEISAKYLYNDDIERGFCFENEWERHVQIKNKTTSEQNLYPLARYIGHQMLNHELMDPTELTEAVIRRKRDEADYYADCLLMPADWLRSAAPGGVVTPADVRRLALLYCVPQDIMDRRLRDLV